jgi:ABC-2 type transport system permease protein
MKEGEIDALVVIPNGLGETVQSASSGEIRVYFDPANQSSQVIIALVKQVIEQTNRQLSQIPVLVGITTESISVYSLKNIDYLIPGILAMAIMFLGLFGSLPLVEWREKQVLKRLGATPLTKLTIVSSQVFYRVILALFQTVLIIAVAYFAFDVNMVGNWLSLFGLVILGILTFVAIGYLAVARPRSVEGAIPIIQLVQFPMLFLSGIFFPIDTMPSFMRPVVEVMPLTYLGDALRQIMTGASPDHSLPLNIIVMFGWFIAASILSIRFFRWE